MSETFEEVSTVTSNAHKIIKQVKNGQETLIVDGVEYVRKDKKSGKSR